MMMKIKCLCSVFHAHKMQLARISKVRRRRFYGGFEETSDVVDIRGTTAQAFETMINFVYQRECGLERKTFEELFEIANLAEMYDIENLMWLVQGSLILVQINLGNVVELAHIAKRLSVFSYFNTTEYEYLLSKCCRFLQRKLCTHVIDFSGLKFSSWQVGTVEMLYDRVLELPLFVCHQCSEFISERHHDCPLRNNTNYIGEEMYDDSDDDVFEDPENDNLIVVIDG